MYLASTRSLVVAGFSCPVERLFRLFTVYTKKNCVQCNATIRHLERRGAAYEAISIDDDPKVLESLKVHYGASQAPVVLHGEEFWTGFRPDLIDKIVK